jgi:hypothetical protein
MQKHLLLGIILATPLIWVQEITIRPRLAPGDQFGIQIEHTRQDSARPESNAASRKHVDVRVVSAGPTGFVIDWRAGVEEYSDATGKPDPQMTMIAGLLENVSFRLVLDRDGALQGIENEAELQPRFAALSELVVAGVRQTQSEMPQAERDKLEAMLRTVLSSANLIALGAKDCQIWLAMNGLSLAVGETAELKLARPNPFGGEALPGIMRLKMESATSDAATVTAVVTTAPEALTRMAASLLEQMGDKVTEDLLAKMRVELIDESRYVFDQKVGLMREVITSRSLSAGANRRTERWLIRRVSDPRRIGNRTDHFEPIALTDLANRPLDWLTTSPRSQEYLGGVPFVFRPGARAVFSTRGHAFPNLPTEGTLTVGLSDVVALHVLVTGGWVVNLEPGEEIGRIRLVFDDGRQVDHALINGRNIREGWEPDRSATDPGERQVGATRWANVWSETQLRGAAAHGFLDMVSIEIDRSLPPQVLSKVVIFDKGTVRPNRLGSGMVDPSIVVVAVTAQVR